MEGRRFLRREEARGYRNGNDIGEHDGVPSEEDKITGTCEKNTSGEIGATTDGIVWLPDLSLEGQVNIRRE